MALSKEQMEVVKKQLLKQIESSQLENKEQIKEHIQSLDEEQLEEFLKQNKIELSNPESEKATPKCIFCSIVNNEIQGYKIAENKNAVAILEINPLSKGHALIIPNEHKTIDKLPKSSLSLAQKIAKKIKKKLKPEDVKIETASIQEHAIINVIPFYKNQKVEKRKASEEELKELQSALQAKKRSPRKKNPEANLAKESIKNLPKISFRIP